VRGEAAGTGHCRTSERAVQEWAVGLCVHGTARCCCSAAAWCAKNPARPDPSAQLLTTVAAAATVANVTQLFNGPGRALYALTLVTPCARAITDALYSVRSGPGAFARCRPLEGQCVCSPTALVLSRGSPAPFQCCTSSLRASLTESRFEKRVTSRCPPPLRVRRTVLRRPDAQEYDAL
jgi:hypothetical protein